MACKPLSSPRSGCNLCSVLHQSLRKLALPLQAEGLVDPELTSDGENCGYDSNAEDHNEGPDLSGNVLELAKTLGGGMGTLLFLRHRAAHLQRLAHEELGALAHHHHARGPHGHGPGNFEHVVVCSRVVHGMEERRGIREWRVERTVQFVVVSSQDRSQELGKLAGVACPENAEQGSESSGGQSAVWGQPIIATLQLHHRHQLRLPPAIAATSPLHRQGL